MSRGLASVILILTAIGFPTEAREDWRARVQDYLQRNADVRDLKLHEDLILASKASQHDASGGYRGVGARLLASTEYLRGSVISASRSKGGLDQARLRKAIQRFLRANQSFQDDLFEQREILSRLHTSVQKHNAWERSALTYAERSEPVVSLAEQVLWLLNDKLSSDDPVLEMAISRLDRALQSMQYESEPTMRLRTSILPVHRLNLPAEPPIYQPAIVPSYARPDPAAVIPQDLEGTLDAPLSVAILQKAEDLDFEYTRINDFVRTQVRTEWYAGSLKGAEGTLASGAGNDVDQASLLIALMRASGAPARYVQGVAEVPVEFVGASLGLSDSIEIVNAIRLAGIPHEPVVEGGQIRAVRLAHTWVTVRVPYEDYRGSVVSAAGPAWIPLAPALKPYQHRPTHPDLLDLIPDAEEFAESYLLAPPQSSPLDTLIQELDAALAGLPSSPSLDEMAGQRWNDAGELGLLPSSLPFLAVSVTREGAVLADDHRQRMVIRIFDESDQALLGETAVNLSGNYGDRLTLSYIPATPEDQDIIHEYGGLTLTPPHLVRLRPRVTVAGETHWVAPASIPMGALHRLQFELAGPATSTSSEQFVHAGTYSALAIQIYRDLPTAEDPDAFVSGDTERVAARYLSNLGYRYLGEWGARQDTLGRLMGITPVRPLPSLVQVINAVSVSAPFGIPTDFGWKGVALDAALNPLSAVGETEFKNDWLAMTAIDGSFAEQEVLESQWFTDAISADESIALALADGQSLITLTDSSVPGDFDQLDFDSSTVDEIHSWTQRGFRVRTHQSALTTSAWSGVGYVVDDPSTGESGYFISGRWAGGATTNPPEEWILDFLVQSLRDPYGAPPNRDPMSAARLFKIPGSDRQRNAAGDALERPLSVLVRDIVGRPVEGAMVTFSLRGGGGGLLDGGQPVQSLTVLSDGLGVASTAFQLPESTATNPEYVFLNPGDEYPTRVNVSLVEVSVSSNLGDLRPETPFSAFATPGELAQLVRLDAFENWVGMPSSDTPLFLFAPQDVFGNPISNQSITVSLGDETRGCESENYAPNTAPAVLLAPGQCPLPPYQDPSCGGSVLGLTSDAEGVRFRMILGQAINTQFPVNLSAGELTAQLEPATGIECVTGPIGRVIVQDMAARASGQYIEAAAPGEPLATDRAIRLFYTAPVSSQYPYSHATLPLQGNVAVAMEGDAQASAFSPIAPGIHQGTITAGTTPGYDGGTIQVSDAQALAQVYHPETDSEIPPGNSFSFDAPLRWGVVALQPEIVSVSPSPVEVGENGLTTGDLEIATQLAPDDYTTALELVIRKDGIPIHRFGAPSGVSHQPFDIVRGLAIDQSQPHDLILAANPYNLFRVESEALLFPLDSELFYDVVGDASLGLGVGQAFISHEVDVPNEQFCVQGGFQFGITRQALVTLTFYRLDSAGNPSPIGQNVLVNELLQAGIHNPLVEPGIVPPGEYQFVLTGSADGEDYQRTGLVTLRFTRRDSLPLGHSLVKGVNLFSGSAVVSRSDVQLRGRGVPLRFRRTYSSTAADQSGPLGAGWTHNYDSRILRTACGEHIVVGGDGGGMRFVEQADGRLMPQRGYHGSLLYDVNTDSYDFYTRSGTRYHYDVQGVDNWQLVYVEDTSGNRTNLTRSIEAHQLLQVVTDAAGRQLTFHYEEQLFEHWQGHVITRIDGPQGWSMHFSYDEVGNLVEARRNNDASIERYAYEQGLGFQERHLITSVTDGLSGAERSYTWSPGTIGIQAPTEDYELPGWQVASIVEADSGVTQFNYDADALIDRGLVPETVVRNPRDFDTTYTMNRYGAVEFTQDPAGARATEWDMTDVQVSARVDANGVRTEFTYDVHGNRLSESIGPDVRQWEYAPATSFEPPFIKNRPLRETDFRSIRTDFTYDTRGRLTSTSRDGLTVSHTYDALGDRRTTIDARGNTTLFRYDSAGHLLERVDSLAGVARTEYDARSRLIRQVDEEGRETTFDYDELDRRVLTRLPDAGSGVHDLHMVFDDSARTQVAIDANGHSTTTRFDLMGREQSVTNAAGDVMTYMYDLNGNKTLSVDFNGNQRSQVYDGADRLIERHLPEGRSEYFVHDPEGNLTRRTIGSGDSARVTEMDYDHRNRVIAERQLLDGRWLSTTQVYDPNGNLIVVTDPMGRVTETDYDAFDRPIEVRSPLGFMQRRTYDANGNLIEQFLENGEEDQLRIAAFDALNREVSRTDAEGHVWTTQHDRVGNRTRETDPRGYSVVRQYDARNRLVRQEGPVAGEVTQYIYDAVGNRIEESWANGNVVVHQFDVLNRLVSSSDSLGSLTTRTYDANGNVISETDANGNVTSRIFDGRNRMVAEHRPESRTTATAYNIHDEPVSVTDPEGNTTTTSYDALGRRTQVTAPAPFHYQQQYEYDDAGNQTAMVDARGYRTTYQYDNLNRRIAQINPPEVGYTQQWSHDLAGNRLSATDRRGIVTQWRYDRENRVLSRRTADLLLETRTYDGAGLLVQLIDANGNVSTFSHDGAGRVLRETRPLGAETLYEYDLMGNPSRELRPEGRTLTRSHDLRNRLVQETNSEGETTTYSYDGNGNRLTRLRPAQQGTGQSWQMVYDGANRLISVTDPIAHQTGYDYDLNDNRVSQTDAEGQATGFTYDSLNRLTQKSLADGNTEHYQYDPAGNRIERIDPLGQRTTWAYDALNRESGRTYEAAQGNELASVTFGYDGNGNRVSATENRADGTTANASYTYDVLDRMVRTTDRWGQQIQSAYDLNNNRVLRVDPQGRQTRYEYDALDRLVAHTDSDGRVSTIDYDTASRVVSLSYANGVVASKVWDTTDRLTEVRYEAGALIAGESYQYDTNGNRTQKLRLETRDTTTYAYDAADRLISYQSPDQQVTYTLDGVANRRTETTTDPASGLVTSSKAYSYDHRHRLTQVDDTVQGVSTTYTWDANGNRLEKVEDAEVTSYTYGPRNRLKTLTLQGAPPATYEYDAYGFRVREQENGNEVRYLYDRQSLFSESNAIGNELAKYEHLNGRLFSQTEASDTAYLHTDALGSPLARTTQSALVEDRTDYTPWGTVTQGDPGRFGFTGHQRDPSGLYYAQQRYYDPETGTFLTEDPWQGDHSIPLSLHRFLYGYANPTVYVDEDGRCPQAVSEIQCHFLTADLLGVDSLSDDGIAAIHQEWAQQGQAQIAALSIYASGAAFLGVRTAATSFGAGVRAFSDDVAQFGWRYALGVRTTQTVVAAELTGEGLALATGAELPPHLTPISTTAKLGKNAAVTVYESVSNAGRNAGSSFRRAPTVWQHGAPSRQRSTTSQARVATSRNQFDRRFPRETFTSPEHADSAWKVYQDTSQGTAEIVMGRLQDTEAGEMLGMQRLSALDGNWDLGVNDAWVQGGIDARRSFYVGSNPDFPNFRSLPQFDQDGNFVGRGDYPTTVFYREMRQLRDAGYRLEGSYMVPPN